MATHLFQTFPGGSTATDSTLAPPGVVEVDPTTKRVPLMLRIHLQDANLPAGCNPYAVVSVGRNCARSKQLLSSENRTLATTGYAFFDEQFVVEYDPRATNFVSVAFFERATNAPLGEWRAPLSRFDHTSHGLLSHLGKHGTKTESSWELNDPAGVPLAPYTGHISGEATPVGTSAPTAASLGAVPIQTPTSVSTTPDTAGAAAPLAAGALGSAHIRVRSEPKLIGTLHLKVREVILASGCVAAPLHLNIKFAAPEQKFITPAISGAGGRYVFDSSEFQLRVDPTNNVRDVFIEVVQSGTIIGETRVTLYDAYRSGGLAGAQPILVHSTKQRIGEMLLESSFDGKPQKR